MKNKNMLTRFSTERNHSQNTKKGYQASISVFEKVIGKNIDELLRIAESEKKLEWENTQLRLWLINFRNHCYKEYKEQTGKKHIERIKTFFTHYDINIGKLPYASTKQVRKSEEIDYEDLPNREILKKCIELKNPLLKAITLFMSSTGISKADTLNLTVQDYLDATVTYHNTNNIYDAIKIMDKSEVSIIPTFKLQRQKTGKTYRTFSSPESVKAINIYLLSREHLEPKDTLFNISKSRLNTIFRETNHKLCLGTVNGRARFTPQMLRSYHASQLSEAGMNDNLIDLIQGRKPQSIARKSYIRIKREKLKEEYIKALPFLVVEDIEEVKTELDVVKKEKEVLERENTEFKQYYDGLREEIEFIKSKQAEWDKIKNDG